MNNVFLKIKKYVQKKLAKRSTALPRGMAEFEAWSNSIIDIYDLPANDSLKFALATMLLHLGPAEAYKPKEYFGLCALKGATSQIAHSIMMELKEKQQVRAKAEQEAAEKAKQTAEVTANETQVPSNVVTLSNS